MNTHGFLPSVKYLKGTVVNRRCLFISEWSLDVTYTVSLRIDLAQVSYIDKLMVYLFYSTACISSLLYLSSFKVYLYLFFLTPKNLCVDEKGVDGSDEVETDVTGLGEDEKMDGIAENRRKSSLEAVEKYHLKIKIIGK